MSGIQTPSATADYYTYFEYQPKYIFKCQYRNMYQNPLNRLYPFNLKIIFLETFFKETEIGKMLNATVFVIVVSKVQPNFKNRLLVK